MNIDAQKYIAYELTLKAATEQMHNLLPEEDIAAVQHYLSHAEIEMAFESLGLSLMKGQISLDIHTSTTLHKLGLDLSLDKESVFDDKFWISFSEYLSTE